MTNAVEDRKPRIQVQSASPLAPIGISAAALEPAVQPSFSRKPKIFEEFSLRGRVAIVTGGNRGLGLETALALCEAGARSVYCFDVVSDPSDAWQATRDYVEKTANGSSLKYICADVRDQEGMWKKVREIGDKEGRMDVCVACAGIANAPKSCLTYPAKELQETLEVNASGALFTAQAAGQQMVRFGNPGSIILVSSICGSVGNRDESVIAYNASKAAMHQMARSMACELGGKKIRVNTVSPGYIHTSLSEAYMKMVPGALERWSNLNPMGRLGRADELRGVMVWLASDASSFCTGSNIVVDGGHMAW